jgi:hypothetical protein
VKEHVLGPEAVQAAWVVALGKELARDKERAVTMALRNTTTAVPAAADSAAQVDAAAEAETRTAPMAARVDARHLCPWSADRAAARERPRRVTVEAEVVPFSWPANSSY